MFHFLDNQKFDFYVKGSTRSIEVFQHLDCQNNQVGRDIATHEGNQCPPHLIFEIGLQSFIFADWEEAELDGACKVDCELGIDLDFVGKSISVWFIRDQINEVR